MDREEEGAPVKEVHVEQLTIIRMSCGGAKRHPIVIDGGVVKEWVGIGWVEKGKATAEDKKKYPAVKQ